MSHQPATDAPTLLEALLTTPPGNHQDLHVQAIDALLAWQLADRPEALPPYDEALMRRELALFTQAYLQQHRGVTLDNTQQATWDKTLDTLVAHNLGRPRVRVHHDFSPRNLLLARAGAAAPALTVRPAQAAVQGPITYDIVSLVRDPALGWEEDVVLDITVRYWEKARKAGLPVGEDFGEFYRSVEWMGLHRHLHQVGLWAQRAVHGAVHDQTPLPRLIDSLRATAARYREFKPLLRLIDQVEGIQPVTGFAYGRI